MKIGINFLFYGEKSYFIFLNISYKYSLVSINAVLNVGFVVCIFFFLKAWVLPDLPSDLARFHPRD